MNIKTEFLKIMAEQTEIALATSVNNIPNVRIILIQMKIYFTFHLLKETTKSKKSNQIHM